MGVNREAAQTQYRWQLQHKNSYPTDNATIDWMEGIVCQLRRHVASSLMAEDGFCSHAVDLWLSQI